MRVLFRAFLAGLLLVIVSACGGAGTAPPASQQASQSLSHSTAVNAPFSYSVHPKLRRITDLLFHNCPQGTDGCALAPVTMKTAYGFNLLKSAPDGSGQNIVIVVAFGSPTIKTDIKTFDAQFGLSDPTLNVVYPGGKATVNLSNATQLGWAEETTLDVEWAHAAAPGAAIALVVGNNDQGQTIQSTLLYAATHYSGSAMSLSFGTPEAAINGGANNTQLTSAEAVYQTARTNNITVIASAGDLGATNGFATPNPQYPASDRNVLSVGGTSLTLQNSQGKYKSESAWNDDQSGTACVQPCGASGGAPSILFPGRNVADVAFDAADTAVDVYIGFSSSGLGVTPGWYSIGGTSVGPPIYAGIIAAVNQTRKTNGKAPVGFINDYLFSRYNSAQAGNSPPFHDIVSGSNAFPLGATGFSVGTGYDYPTGLGTPITNNFINLLVQK